MTRYESLLASRYIKTQKRQSAFTVISIATAVAVITMIFILYSVCISCLRNTFYSSAPYHLVFSELTEEQGEAMADFKEVRSVKLSRTKDGTITAAVLFGSDIGDRELWLQKTAQKIGASEQYEHSKNNSMHGAYEWNDNLMMIDGIGDGAHLFKLRIFCIFFIFAVLVAFALRLIIDTAFEVSSKERERHYGVLQSIGATPEQIVRIITYEGLRLCIIGIPLGLITGIGLAYLMYNVLLAAGVSELFQGMTSAKLSLPFSVDWRMLLISAAVGILWVFLSAYGVGMRIIKKAPMEAIITRTDKVEKVRKRTLSGLLFGISGKLASRNARRQKKRFIITVLTLTVSITLFALFSSLTETVEQSVITFLDMEMDGADFYVDLVDDPYTKITYEDGIRDIKESGMFRDIGISVTESIKIPDIKRSYYIEYLNKEEFYHRFSKDSPISYEELVTTGGYILNGKSVDYDGFAEKVKAGKTTLISQRRTVSEDKLKPDISVIEYRKLADTENIEHEMTVLGVLKPANDNLITSAAVMIGAIETYQSVHNEWFGDTVMANSSFSYVKENNYNTNDYKKIIDWINEHTDTVSIAGDNYGTKWIISSVMATVRAGVLILNVLIALAALINLLNIISTGIANRRSELASLQCVGMTDRQLDRMAIIECLQFTGAAAIISAIICSVVIFGTEFGLPALINASLVDESKETREMLLDIVRIDHITPFLRIVLASLMAFAAGCVTSLIMLRIQNTESLSNQIRGSEMKLDAPKSHILRNSVIAVIGAAVLVIAGLRTYSVISYRNDRKEYEKAGYLNLVESNGFKMNVYSTGAEDGKHTIVGLAGQASFAFPVETTELNKMLGEENTLVYPDCAGCGFSDDSFKPQTVEQIVEDYRTGLKNAGFEAPYVLMAHSIADFYAMYWEMQYPDEVEAIVILDGSIPPKSELWQTYTVEEEFPSEDAGRAAVRRLVLRTSLGLNRLFPDRSSDGGATEGAATFTDEQLRFIKLCNNRFWTAGFASEILLEKQEVTNMGEMLHPTDTPKLYFTTLYTCEADVRASFERMKSDYEAEGKEFNTDPETAARAEWKQIEWEIEQARTEENDFMDRIGNCRLEYVAGDHGIFYAQEPEQIANSILNFLAETTE